ncbi:histidine kinase [Natrarchaeobius sp. A-rgal3]|uniref:histidine kinase n=1 Tax=Natrarchaeobius versutus TaxID=1679078 RepID=UPI00350F1233
MASEAATQTETGIGVKLAAWQAGLVGGIVGGVVFGIMMTMQMPMIIESAIPGMYGLGPEALAVGWVIHLGHSAVLGIVFAVLVGMDGVRDRLDSPLKIGVAGLVYGVVLWVILASFVMPAWVGAMTGMAPPVPDWNVESLMGHAVYGVILGVVCGALSR